MMKEDKSFICRFAYYISAHRYTLLSALIALIAIGSIVTAIVLVTDPGDNIEAAEGILAESTTQNKTEPVTENKTAPTTENKTEMNVNETTEVETTTVEQEETDDIGSVNGNNNENETDSKIISDSPYLIKVNRILNCITVYAKDGTGNYTMPVKAIACSTGRVSGTTPLGTFQTMNQYTWRKMLDNSYAQYASRVHGPILLHSVPYYTMSKGDLENLEYNKLGSVASMGCIRMTVIDAKWLFDNCPIGTTVIIYDDPTVPGPLGRPEIIHIPEDHPYRGWDPTDPDINNPWRTCSAEITGATDQTVEIGSDIAKLLANVTAKDTCGNDITDRIEIRGHYDLNKAGIYEITYSVTDLLGSSAMATVILTVADQQEIDTTKRQSAEKKTTQPSVQQVTKKQQVTQPKPTEQTTTWQKPTETKPKASEEQMTSDETETELTIQPTASQ